MDKLYLIAEAMDKLWRVHWRLTYANPGWPTEICLISEAIETLAEARHVSV